MSAPPRRWYRVCASDSILELFRLTLEERGAYRTLIDHTCENNRELRDDSQIIAHLCGCSTRRWNQIRERLILMGKITITTDGKLRLAHVIKFDEKKGSY